MPCSPPAALATHSPLVLGYVQPQHVGTGFGFLCIQQSCTHLHCIYAVQVAQKHGTLSNITLHGCAVHFNVKVRMKNIVLSCKEA